MKVPAAVAAGEIHAARWQGQDAQKLLDTWRDALVQS